MNEDLDKLIEEFNEIQVLIGKVNDAKDIAQKFDDQKKHYLRIINYQDLETEYYLDEIYELQNKLIELKTFYDNQILIQDESIDHYKRKITQLEIMHSKLLRKYDKYVRPKR